MPHTAPHPLSPLMMFLAGLYAAAHRPIARPAARHTGAALIEAASAPSGPLPFDDRPQPALDALAIAPLPVREVIAAALPFHAWTDASGALARLTPDWAAGMPMTQLIGPSGQFFNPDIRVGLAVQTPDVHESVSC